MNKKPKTIFIILLGLLPLYFIQVIEHSLIINSGYIAQAQTGIWQKIKSIFTDTARDGGTRHDFCSLSPARNTPIPIWHTRLLFIWSHFDSEGEVRTIEQIEVKDSNNDTLWLVDNPSVTSGENYSYIEFGGQNDLREGEIYYYNITHNLKRETIAFMVMTPEEREEVSIKLNEYIEQISPSTPEEIAVYRALFWLEERGIDKRSTADAVQELFKLHGSSPELESYLQEIVNEACGLTVEAQN